MSQIQHSQMPVAPDNVGQQKATIQVELSTRFLEQFSEHLYSSPQKAFEELISNGWDAGASCVEIQISDDLTVGGATMCVLDNGSSMDEDGLRELWHIAFSPKRDKPVMHGRATIGKFGIGKLATYVLAERLTYICKAADGVIRRVTMDYSEVDKQQRRGDTKRDTLISELQLDVYTVEQSDLEGALKQVHGGSDILGVIQSGPRSVEAEQGEDEYGGEKCKLDPPKSGTWTLVVLSSLKKVGRELKLGVLKRMLRAALPFGSEMSIRVNGDSLKPSKIEAATIVDWTIGPELEISEIEIEEEEESVSESEGATATPKADKTRAITRVALGSGNTPVPFIDIPGVGRVTGRVKLFREPISGGKSEKRGASNGFHINVLGRVVNQGNSSFGEKDLSHAAWARFRMTVRADDLNRLLNTNREQFREQHELRVFRAFLRKLFNKARARYDDDAEAALSDGGDLLVRSLGVVSLNPLRNVVEETLKTKAAVPDLFDEDGIEDKKVKLASWKQSTTEKISSALGEVKFEKSGEGGFVKFRLLDNSIVINKEHPFVLEYSGTKAEKQLLRTMAMINLLSDVYAIDIGVEASALRSTRDYRERLMRFMAMQSRKSGTYIAKLLLQTEHKSNESKQLELVVSDALRYLGFQVKDLAKPGQPEGIASAYPLPTRVTVSDEEPKPPMYSFSFDAKSSKHENAKTGNINLDGLFEHRKRYRADFALVIAPGFSGEAITTRCQQQKITPMPARDLGKLLEYTVEMGAIPLDKFKEVFSIYDHKEVSKWVEALGDWIRKKRVLTIDVFMKALALLKGLIPDSLPAATIALQCRDKLGVVSVRDKDVEMLAQGLQILVPDLIGVEGDKIVVNASPERVAEAIKSQLENLRSEKSEEGVPVQATHA